MDGLDGAEDEPLVDTQAPKNDEGFRLKFCTVCASNQNRSVNMYIVVPESRLLESSTVESSLNIKYFLQEHAVPSKTFCSI